MFFVHRQPKKLKCSFFYLFLKYNSSKLKIIQLLKTTMSFINNNTLTSSTPSIPSTPLDTTRNAMPTPPPGLPPDTPSRTVVVPTTTTTENNNGDRTSRNSSPRLGTGNPNQQQPRKLQATCFSKFEV